MKRSLSIDELTNNQIEIFQKLNHRKETSVTCIEDLTNDLFREIFNYLDGCDIFEAFSNLNARFQEMIYHPLFPLKIYRFSTREQTFKRYCKQIIIPNRYQIISIHLFDQVLIDSFCSLCHLDMSFNRLNSLVLYGIKLDQLIMLLNNAWRLFRLVSLNIHLIGDYENLIRVYRLIFHLPTLKSLKFSVAIERRIDCLSLATPRKISTIENLNINHRCTFCQLNRLLSYTPNLRRLICPKLFNWTTEFSLRHQKLEYISIKDCNFTFDQFELFIKEIGLKLKVLRIGNLSNDVTYLHAARWKQLITRYIPNLRVFNFQYSEFLTPDYSFTLCHARINRFTTPFWIENQWILGLDVNSNRITYSIHSFRKQWCDSLEATPQPATQLSITQLYGKNSRIIFDRIGHISFWIQITRLYVDCSTVSLKYLMKLVQRLRDVHSLKIVAIATYEIDTLIEISPESRSNQITKLHIGLVTDIAQVTFFLSFFPHLKYLELNCTNDIDLELLLESVIMKVSDWIIPQLRSLCLCVGQTNEQVLERLTQVMTRIYFFHDFTIKHVSDKIYLQWK